MGIHAANASPADAPRFGGTLPSLPTPIPSSPDCEYSNSGNPVIKGIITDSGGRTYHIPGSASYYKVNVDESRGDRWLCTEAEAAAQGWARAQ